MGSMGPGGERFEKKVIVDNRPKGLGNVAIEATDANTE